MSRKLRNWLETYVAYVASASEAPLDYHAWAGLTAVSATLKRNVHIGRGTYKLYPNLFTVLVGRPGLGKGSAIGPALSLLKASDTANILSDRVTIEYILERMAKGWSGIAGSGGKINVVIDHSCLVVSRELSVF